MLASREPFCLAALRPTPLVKWINMARVAVGKLSGPMACDCVIIGIYGLHRDHGKRSMNEGMLLDCMSYAATLKMPTILCRDLNDTTHSSMVLGRADRFPLTRASPDAPTTLRHDNTVGRGLPIDHIYLNKAAACLSYKTRVDYTVRLSDHFPLLMSFCLPSARSSIICAKWASPSSQIVLKPSVERPINPEDQVRTLSEWHERSVTWLRRATGQGVEKKATFTTKEWRPKTLEVDLKLARLFALQRLCREIEHYGVDWNKAWSLFRKVSVLACSHDFGGVWDLPTLQERIWVLIEQHLDQAKDAYLKERKEKVVGWKPNARQAFQYLRNDLPTPQTAVLHEEKLVAHPA